MADTPPRDGGGFASRASKNLMKKSHKKRTQSKVKANNNWKKVSK